MFGAMFAPRPQDVAREMVRVVRPGGRIVMGNWIPGDPTLVAQVLRISASYSPPPPEGFVSPMLWGNEAEVTARFVAAGIPAENIGFARKTYFFRAEMSPGDFLAVFRDFYGPSMNAFAAAASTGRSAALQAELEALFIAQNQSTQTGRTDVPATFLQVTVAVP
jgi:SAM-dependent methyltransferase